MIELGGIMAKLILIGQDSPAVNETITTHVSDTTKHITTAERATWNAKANTTVATTSANGLMAAADKVKLNEIAAGASNNAKLYRSTIALANDNTVKTITLPFTPYVVFAFIPSSVSTRAMSTITYLGGGITTLYNNGGGRWEDLSGRGGVTLIKNGFTTTCKNETLSYTALGI